MPSTLVTTPAAPRKKRGQSLVELAITIPIMAVLLLGGFDCTMLVWDKLVAGYAVRQGTRLASELGGRQTNPTATQADIDKKIVRNVLAVTKTWGYGTLLELDIYGATRTDGVMQGTDYQDQFDGSGNPLAVQTLTLERRYQTPPDETAIGVRLLWRFTVPAGSFGNMNFTEYAVMKVAPVLN
ncbi:MAG TPA: TadE/TadG family type IV pilus assembly protein [Candidatus Dormibacteraeota bacterium]|nr:TadE/TadG family type IV pilus assembly protein [Candidatus Dormibacteraeota bacterium]